MNIAVVGGGLTGLTAAYELLKKGHRVTVFEKGSTLGGLAGGFKLPSWNWHLEFFYHHFFTNDAALISLVKELGLEKDMLILRPVTATLCRIPEVGSRTSEKNTLDGVRLGIPGERPQYRNLLRQSLHNLGKIFMWSEDKKNAFEVCGTRTSAGERRTTGPVKNSIFQFDSPLHLLTFPLLSPFDKIRTAVLLAFCKINPFWQPLEKITAVRFFKTIGGSRAWNMLWQPLMQGKFARYANNVPASWLWARFHKRTMRLGYFRGGFRTFIDALAKAIIRRGGKIYTNTAISNIQQPALPAGGYNNRTIEQCNNITMKQWNIEWKSNSLRFDKVLLTAPSSTAVKLLNNHQSPITNVTMKQWSNNLLSIPHLWAQTLILETDKPILDNTYWLNIADPSFPFVAVVAHTNMIDKKYYGGRHITYIGNYLPDGHLFLTMTKQQLLKIFLPYIQLINKQCNNVAMKQCYLFTAPSAQPVHTLNYSHKAPKIRTPVEGVYLANLDSIYPWDRGTNYAVELGQQAASIILSNML